MSDLLDKARLTDEEIMALREELVADCATAKALWAVVDTLQATSENHLRGMGGQWAKLLLDAGIERPKEKA